MAWIPVFLSFSDHTPTPKKEKKENILVIMQEKYKVHRLSL